MNVKEARVEGKMYCSECRREINVCILCNADFANPMTKLCCCEEGRFHICGECSKVRMKLIQKRKEKIDLEEKP